MKNPGNFLRRIVLLAVIGLFVLGAIILIRAASQGGDKLPPLAAMMTQIEIQQASETLSAPAYPAPATGTISAEADEPVSIPAYPAPPGGGATDIPKTVVYIETTPGEWMPPSETPQPTFTPYPTLTLPPGPTATSLPLVTPAKDAAGEILFLTRSAENNYALDALEVNPIGEAKSILVRLISNLTIKEDSSLTARYSPNGQRIALAGEALSLEIIDSQTGKMENVSPPFEVIDRFFNWFPDNLRFLSRDYGFMGLRSDDLQSMDYTQLIVPGYGAIEGADASPDGRQIVYSYQKDQFLTPSTIMVMSAEGQDARLVAEITGTVLHLAWSPDGKKIAFFGDGLMVMEVDGSNLRKMDAVNGPLCYSLPPLWSPDSSQLAIVVSGSPEPFCTGWNEEVFKETNILIVDVESGKSHPLLPDGSTGNIDPAWSPDGSQIAFVSNRGGSPDIWAVSVEGENLRQLTKDGMYKRFPYWRSP